MPVLCGILTPPRISNLLNRSRLLHANWHCDDGMLDMKSLSYLTFQVFKKGESTSNLDYCTKSYTEKKGKNVNKQDSL